MGRKPKISAEEKVYICEQYLNGKSSMSLSQAYGINNCTVHQWIHQYQKYGAIGFQIKSRNKKYTKEFKQEVVEAYLRGEGSAEQLSLKYNIPSYSTLLNWIVKYNNLEILKDYDPKPEVYMKERKRKTTHGERIGIVKHCLSHNQNYKETAEMFNVSYSQVYQWTKKYLDSGDEGLTDKRGKRKEETQLSETEILQRRVKILERKLKEKEMENELLKKVQEIERRWSSPKRKTN